MCQEGNRMGQNGPLWTSFGQGRSEGVRTGKKTSKHLNMPSFLNLVWFCFNLFDFVLICLTLFKLHKFWACLIFFFWFLPVGYISIKKNWSLTLLSVFLAGGGRILPCGTQGLEGVWAIGLSLNPKKFWNFFMITWRHKFDHCALMYSSLNIFNYKYRPSGIGGTRSPPATPLRLKNPKWQLGDPKMADGVWKGVYP